VLPAVVLLYVTLQEPEESVQEEGAKEPDGAPNETVPVGLLPVTVAVQDVEPPTVKDVGEQEAVTVVDADPTVTDSVPELPALFASPGYDAVRVTVPAVELLYVTLQVPDESVQEEGAKEPDGAPNETVPVGLLPVTVAVQDVEEPAAKEDGTQESEVVDGESVTVT
jgi:hypothetical protein